ncbi:MAG: hypothetical protein ABI601_14635 [bacterium]
MHRAPLAAFATCVLATLISCGGDNSAGPSTTDGFSGAGVRILTPRTVEDTIDAFLATPLALEVHDSTGKPAIAIKVDVDSHRDPPDPFRTPVALFSLSSGAAGVQTLSEVTDSRGRLEVSVRLGSGVTSGWITVGAGALGRDSIRVVVSAGKPARLLLAPRDTALAVGASYTPSAIVRDRQGNVVSDLPTLVSRRAQAASVANGTITTTAPGRVYVVGTAGTAVDSVAVSVVPSGTLIAFRFIYSSGDTTTIATFDLDGTSYQRTVLPGYGFNNYAPRLLPPQNLLVFHGRTDSFGNGLGMFTMNVSNQPNVLYFPTPDGNGAYPQPTRDGTWIYYTQQVGYQSNEIWRMRPDGTSRARVGPQAGYYDSDSQASPSPDGRTIVYISNDGGLGSGVVRLNRLDVASGIETSLNAIGSHPRWSPVSNDIAYLTGSAVRLVQSDGTGDRVLATGQNFEDRDGQVEWSPDGKWLVACTRYEHSGGRRLVLIERATGDVLPLPFTYGDNLCDATWKR